VRITLYKDETLSLSLDSVAQNVTRLAPGITVESGRSQVSIVGSIVSSPDSYRKLVPSIIRECADSDMVLVFTNKPYDNNYFWESDRKEVIVSLSEWEDFTTLPRSNGVVYFMCAILVQHLGIGTVHQDNTGCINDFWWDKAGIDVGMRTAFICPACVRRDQRRGNKSNRSLRDGLQAVLNDLSIASRSNRDICEYWSSTCTQGLFDVFLCHNNQDKESVRSMNVRLKAKNIRTWFDEEQLPPGRPWQRELEERIADVRTAVIFVGLSGVGPWQDMELQAFLSEFVRRRCPVIPVILPECATVPQLPIFLRQFTWVDFRKTTPDPFKQLLWGITGRRP
jgi:hypothetical protein